MDDNIHNLRDALEWLDRRIREEAEYDGEMTNEHAIQLGFITNMLEKFPLRQCDMGTAEEQVERHRVYCRDSSCDYFPMPKTCVKCFATWAQTPYVAQKGDKQ